MNSFALLQDDVEDASDLTVNTTPYPAKGEEEEEEAAAEVPSPAPVQDARSSRPVDRKRVVPESTDSAPELAGTDAKPAAPEEKADAAPPPPPKEKEMTLEEYLAKKAQMSSGLASLNNKKGRKADDAAFSKMSVLKKADVTEPESDASIMSTVAVKEQHENKALKDSTHAAVAKNAEIQQFFKREPRSNSGRGRGDRRFNSDSRGGRGGPPRHDGGRPQRDFRRDQRNGFGNGPRGDVPAQQPRSFPGAQISGAPNVDDTAAFPSL